MVAGVPSGDSHDILQYPARGVSDYLFKSAVKAQKLLLSDLPGTKLVLHFDTPHNLIFSALDSRSNTSTCALSTWSPLSPDSLYDPCSSFLT